MYWSIFPKIQQTTHHQTYSTENIADGIDIITEMTIVGFVMMCSRMSTKNHAIETIEKTTKFEEKNTDSSARERFTGEEFDRDERKKTMEK